MKRKELLQNTTEKEKEYQEITDLTWLKPSLRSGADWIACADVAIKERFLSDLSEGELMALPFLFEFWAMDHQFPPDGDWRSWVILGGRGAGKTRAGAEWVRAMVEGPRPLDGGRASRVALVAETLDQARDVMIFGDSGIMACSPPDRRPKWEATKKRMVWPNGATAQIFSAHDPQGLRGPQFDAVWCDELAKWRNGQDTWDMLQFALRLGDDPRVCVTTTPRAVDVLKTLLASPSTVMTHAPTSANRANLAASFLAEVNARYAGTRLGRQELDGVLIDAVDGALWRDPDLAQLTVDTCPELARVVVAVDPPVTGHARSDSCGIIVAGILAHDPTRAVVIADYSVQGTSPPINCENQGAIGRNWVMARCAPPLRGKNCPVNQIYAMPISAMQIRWFWRAWPFGWHARMGGNLDFCSAKFYVSQ